MIVDNALYRDGERVDLGCDTGDLAAVRTEATGPHDFVWVGLHDPSSEELSAVADLYDLHELAVEDALSAHQRPKVERYADSLFIVLKTLWYVDEVETSVFSTERTNDAARIYVLKRELAEMRRAVVPLREPMNRFTAGAVSGIHSDAGPYFRDVGDHLSRVSEVIESLDSLLSTAFDAHLAQISIQQNDDMRRISAAVGLVAAPTLIAGIYGMNFKNMPELDWHLGYPMAIGLMLLSSLFVFVISKRAGWL